MSRFRGAICREPVPGSNLQGADSGELVLVPGSNLPGADSGELVLVPGGNLPGADFRELVLESRFREPS